MFIHAPQGISPRSKVETAVEAMIDEMGLGEYADKLVGGYSSGNKRKLSVAIAMIGRPQVAGYHILQPRQYVVPAHAMGWKLRQKANNARHEVDRFVPRCKV